jgi:hypothetical protein
MRGRVRKGKRFGWSFQAKWFDVAFVPVYGGGKVIKQR